LQPALHVLISQVALSPHLVMPHPPLLQACRRQLALAPSQEMVQAPPQASMLQVLPAPQLSMLQFPPVQVVR
jgi:hypothetical protein